MLPKSCISRKKLGGEWLNCVLVFCFAQCLFGITGGYRYYITCTYDCLRSGVCIESAEGRHHPLMDKDSHTGIFAVCWMGRLQYAYCHQVVGCELTVTWIVTDFSSAWKKIVDDKAFLFNTNSDVYICIFPYLQYLSKPLITQRNDEGETIYLYCNIFTWHTIITNFLFNTLARNGSGDSEINHTHHKACPWICLVVCLFFV